MNTRNKEKIQTEIRTNRLKKSAIPYITKLLNDEEIKKGQFLEKL